MELSKILLHNLRYPMSKHHWTGMAHCDIYGYLWCHVCRCHQLLHWNWFWWELRMCIHFTPNTWVICNFKYEVLFCFTTYQYVQWLNIAMYQTIIMQILYTICYIKYWKFSDSQLSWCHGTIINQLTFEIEYLQLAFHIIPKLYDLHLGINPMP